MELCTPCAGTRPGAADPTRSKAAYPPPRWVFGYLLIDCGQKVLVFSGLRTEKLNLVLLGEKILNFGVPGIENIDFWCSGERNI